MMGNRNDAAQRAALHFLRLLREQHTFIKADTTEQQEAVDASLDTYGSKPTTARITGEELHALFEKFPNIAKMANPDAAYMKLKAVHGPVGGIIKFRAVWRQLAGIRKPTKIKTTQKQTAAATAALQAMEQAFDGSRVTASFTEEEATLEGLSLFVNTLREINLEAVFSSREVCAWAVSYYESVDQRAPRHFLSHHKLAILLGAHQEILGIELIHSPGMGGKMFKFKDS